MLATAVDVDPKAPFSMATTPICSSILPLICTL